MDETIKNTVEEQTTILNEVGEVNVTQEASPSTDDALKDAIDAQLKKISRQNLLIGAQTVCTVVLQKITTAMSKPGKRTMNDYKRVIKDVENFCRTGLSRKVNEDGETEIIDEESVVGETVQN